MKRELYSTKLPSALNELLSFGLEESGKEKKWREKEESESIFNWGEKSGKMKRNEWKVFKWFN